VWNKICDFLESKYGEIRHKIEANRQSQFELSRLIMGCRTNDDDFIELELSRLIMGCRTNDDDFIELELSRLVMGCRTNDDDFIETKC
jgi:hypothetical protein